MLTETELREDLLRIGITPGMQLYAYVAMEAIGPVEGGAAALVRVFRSALGDEGTLLAPAFTPCTIDPAESGESLQTAEEIERLRAETPLFDRDSSPADTEYAGAFSEAVRLQPDAHRSDHPVYSFVAVGRDAEEMTSHAPFRYPLGSGSPIAHLHRANGWILIVGAGQEANPALSLAEVWADAPYIHRPVRVKTGADRWSSMQGRIGCTDGFPRLEPVMRQARILHRGQLGAAATRLMRVQEAVSLAVTMLQSAADALLCDDPNCPFCHVARKFTEQSTYIDGQSL